MKAAALYYASQCPGWSDQVGMFVHVFGHNSVNSLHIHILDLTCVGPTFHKYSYKNCPLDAIIKVLREEIANRLAPPVEQLAARAAASQQDRNALETFASREGGEGG